MRVLGIDPGYAILGWGIIEMKGNHFTPIHFGAITTESENSMSARLLDIYHGLNQIIDTYKPEVVSIEQLFFNTNSKTAILVSQARGVAILAAAEKSLPIFEYTPLQIKQALVGYGRAEKNQVQQMVKTILCLEKIPKPDDTADALAAAVCYCHSAGYSKRLQASTVK